MKRFLSFFLALVMVFTMIPQGAFAAEEILLPAETAPAAEATEPSEEATEPSEETTEPPEEVTEPSEETTEPSEEVTEPSEEATEPSEEATEPSEEATEPSEEVTKPSEEATEPSEEATEPSEEATEPTEVTLPDDTSELSGEEPTVITGGSCGANARWTLTSDGTLTISGTGPMADYSSDISDDTSPWKGLWYETVVVEEGITSVGRYAFKGMTTVILADSVEVIGPYAFYMSGALTTINMPRNLKRIGDEAFDFCSITELHLPEGFTTIGDSAFANCRKLKTVTFPDTLTTIGSSAFSCCFALDGVVLPDSVTSIGEQAFSSSGITDISLPKNASVIGKRMFNNCDNLTTVAIPEGVTEIGYEAFSSCDNLTSVVFPRSLRAIGHMAFWNCESLKELRFQGDAPSFGVGTFGTYNYVKATAYYPSDNPTWTEEVLQDCGGNLTWKTHTVTPVEPGPTEPEEPTQPEEPTEPEEVTTVAGGSCGTYVNWTLTSDGTLTISGNGAMKKYTGSARVPWDAYKNPSDGTVSIKSVVVQKGITSICNSAFSRCKNLETVSIADSVKTIGIFAFSQCKKLKEITLPKGLTVIEQDVFSSSGLTRITIPEGVTTIGPQAFQFCYDLAEVNLPQSLTSIGPDAFYECENLREIVFPDNVTQIPTCAFTNCKVLEHVTLPAGLTTIGTSAFASCLHLKDVILPEGLTTIKDSAFSACKNIKNMVIPKSVTFLGLEAIYGVIPNITFLGDVPTFNGDFFDSIGSAVIYYPGGNPTWTAGVRKQKLGLTWKAWYPEILILDHQLNNISGTTIDVDMHAGQELQLNFGFKPHNDSRDVTWSTNNAAVATVKAGVVTFHKPGTVTISAKSPTAKNPAKVTFKVTYLDPAKTLTAAAEIPAAGLQYGETALMKVFGADKQTPISTAHLGFSIPEDQQQIATVDEHGTITAGTRAGTVTVTAAITGDPLNRKATLKVKVVPIQVQSLRLLPMPHQDVEMVWLDADGNVTDSENAVTCTLNVDKAALTESMTISVRPEARDIHGNLIPAEYLDLLWSSGDSAVATVSTTDDGYGELIPKSDGVSVITAVSNDLVKAEAEITIHIRDYAPRLGAGSLTLNSNLLSGTAVPLLESYGNAVESVSLHEPDTGKESSLFVASFEGDEAVIAAGTPVKNSSYKLTLKAHCENGKTYEYPIILKVSNSLPSVTVKQLTRLNTFYKDGAARFRITAKTGNIQNAVFVNDAFLSDYDADTGILTVTRTAAHLNSGEKLNQKGTIEVSFEDYLVPVSKAQSVGTEKKAPKLTLSASSSIINTALKSEPSTTFFVEGLEAEDVKLEVVAPFASVQTHGAEATLTLTGTKGGTAAVYVTTGNWTDTVKLTHKVTVQSKLPALQLDQTTVKLNRNFTSRYAAVQTSVQVANNISYTISEVVPTSKPGEAGKIQVTVSKSGCIFRLDPENLPKKGTYSFTMTAALEDGTELAPKTIKVTVEDKVPTVKLKTTTLKLNKQLTQGSYEAFAETALTVSEKDFALADLVTADGQSAAEGWNNGDFGFRLKDTLEVTLLTAKPDSDKQTVTLYPVVSHWGKEYQLEKPVTLKLQAYSGDPKVTVKASGKLDTILPGSALTYTITKLTNITGTPTAVRLEGDGAELFNAELNAAGNAVVTLADGSVHATSKTHKLKLVYTIFGQEVEVPVSIKVTQSAVKFAAVKPLNFYQSNGELDCVITVTAPEGAEIGDITLSAKTPEPFRKALREDALVWTEQENGTILVSFQIRNPGYLVPGKSYTVYLDITPEGNASNVKPAQLKLTVKAFR